MNLLITGAWSQTEKWIPRIREQGHETVFLQKECDPLPCQAEWVEGIICGSLFRFHPIESFPNLKYVQLTAAGMDCIPLEYALGRGIQVFNARDVYSIPVAEYAVAGVLSLYKQMRSFQENQSRREWRKNRTLQELYGRTVAVVGCGCIGKACAERFRAFGCVLRGFDRTERENPLFQSLHALDRLDDWLGTADIVILALALADGTRNILDARRISLLKENAVVVNVGRGALIDEKALEKRIDTLGGAVLDVFEQEPLDPESVLWEKRNVIITPHNSFCGNGNAERLKNCILGNLEKAGRA